VFSEDGGVARSTEALRDAWTALARTMIAHGYRSRPEETDSYNCRQITGGSGLSLHSYGIAWT